LKRVLPEKEDPSLPPKTNPVTALCGNGIFYARLLLGSGTGFGAPVLGHWIQGIGFWAPFSEHRIQDIDIRALVFGHLSLGVGN
jgi:hypothetical protein